MSAHSAPGRFLPRPLFCPSLHSEQLGCRSLPRPASRIPHPTSRTPFPLSSWFPSLPCFAGTVRCSLGKNAQSPQTRSFLHCRPGRRVWGPHQRGRAPVAPLGKREGAPSRVGAQLPAPRLQTQELVTQPSFSWSHTFQLPGLEPRRCLAFREEWFQF